MGINDVRPIDIERQGAERRLAYDVQGDIEGKRVLVVEDDLPTGIGMVMAKEEFLKRGAEVKVAAVYVNEKSRSNCDFYAEVREEMPDYPWKQFNDGDRTRE